MGFVGIFFPSLFSKKERGSLNKCEINCGETRRTITTLASCVTNAFYWTVHITIFQTLCQRELLMGNAKERGVFSFSLSQSFHQQSFACMC